MDRPSPLDRLSHRVQITLLLGHVALAGCVDAIGWMLLGGVFVSFMSGNSTQLAVALAAGQMDVALRVGSVLLAFFGGVFVGALMRDGSKRNTQPALFAVAAVVLASSLVMVRLSGVTTLHMLPLAFAMGLLNNARRLVGGVAIGGTFVTGAFVSAADGLARWTLGLVHPRAVAPHALSWLALGVGALAGALLVLRAGDTVALAVPAVWAAALAVAHWLIARRA